MSEKVVSLSAAHSIWTDTLLFPHKYGDLLRIFVRSGWMGSDLGCFVALNDRVPLTRTKPTKLPSALPTPPDLDNAGKENVTHSSGQPLPP
ncbi:unnamed protein product [Leuciscus chuanchicus]